MQVRRGRKERTSLNSIINLYLQPKGEKGGCNAKIMKNYYQSAKLSVHKVRYRIIQGDIEVIRCQIVLSHQHNKNLV